MKRFLNLLCHYFEKIFYFVIENMLHLSWNDKRMQSVFQFIKFGLVGVSNTVVHYLIYLICSLIGFHYILANFLAFTVSVLNSFYWNSRYVFTEEEKTRFRPLVLLKTYIAYGITGLLLNSILLYIEIEIWNMNELLAPILNLLITIPLNFVINKFWAYKKRH